MYFRSAALIPDAYRLPLIPGLSIRAFVVGVWHFNIAPDHDGEGNGGSTLSTYQSFILTTLSWILYPQHAFI